MKKKNLIILVSFIVTAAIILYRVTDCGACISQRDYEFMAKVKENLRKPGDVVKISDIHPGDWTQVCVEMGGVNNNLKASVAAMLGVSESEMIVDHDAKTAIRDEDRTSAIIFIYPPARMEVYRMTSDKLAYMIKESSCLDQKDAYLKHSGDRKNSFSEETLKAASIAEDYIRATIISKDGIDNGI